MDWFLWGVVLAVGLVSAITGAFLHARRDALLRAAMPCWLRVRRILRRLQGLRSRPPRRRALPAPTRQPTEDVVVLIPDGRPWPLGPAVQLLELAWRWQVVHGTNLPLRARQGEGAYVWRPPLPARATNEQPGAEAER